MIVLSNFNCARSALRKKIGIFKAILRKTNRKSSKKWDFELFQILVTNKTHLQTFGDFLVTNKTPEKTFGRFELKGGGFNSNQPVPEC